jgi:dipeptidyl aminopeptidase/acylaminoacyl peptidase
MAPPPPETRFNGESGRLALLLRESVFPVARLARPWRGIAGFRFDPNTGVSGVAPRILQVEIVSARRPGTSLGVWRPEDGARLEDVRFSTDGRMLSAVLIGDGPARLGLFDIESGIERRLDIPIQAAWGNPCVWASGDSLVCRLLPEQRPPAPVDRLEPDVAEHEGGATPLRTYSNLLDNEYEEEIFEYSFASELARVGTDGEVVRIPETRGLLSDIELSPDGRLAVVTRIEPPYSHMAPARRFPSSVEIWSLSEGTMLYASPASGLGVHSDQQNEPRRFAWRSGEPTTLGWIEEEIPAESGDRKRSGQRWVSVEAPFGGAEPREIARSDRPIHNFAWTTEGTPIFSVQTEGGDGIRIHIVGPEATSLFWSGDAEDRYADPGRALRVDGDHGAILEWQGRVFLAGETLDAGRPRPFLEAVDLVSFESERLFESSADTYEMVIGILDPAAPAFVTSSETETTPPSYYVVRGDDRTILREFVSPYPGLDQLERRRVEYQREDGVDLAGTLYLPSDWEGAEALPTLIWIYPREYSDREIAELPDVRQFRFHHVRGASPLAAALRGYAVLVNPTMPIIGRGETVNNEYLPQLARDAKAAIDHLVEIGVSDRKRIAIGGHSYGAFSAANLLVHTRLFATGILVSGAYNRTLTPFGFQSEKRSLWEATDFYARVSPFFQVDQLAAPIFVAHGGGDPNAGTPPLQARRFFHALVGVGAEARYVEMPFEGHNMRGRESVLHLSSEMIAWLDRTIGPPVGSAGSKGPRGPEARTN